MDRMLYVAMSGAKETLRAQGVNNHNVANASTTGFRADLAAFQSRAVDGTGWASRVYATNSTTGWNHHSGALVASGRDLDVAINGEGWLAVQTPDGNEAYTRAGDLAISADGMLRTSTGRPVLGDGGPLSIPPYTSLFIARDGSISIVPQGQDSSTTATVGRLKLVNPPREELARGEDGLFRLRDGTVAPAEAAVQIAQGTLESSNVNAAESIVNMIELARRFEMQVKAIKTAEQNADSATRLMRMS
ncbi:MAG TPA: flagellar basal-body rod protein FlgF [Steroidobacteraceae bacterium]|nr:flagellar basal-body rod protein FlgF [Steroidobacteraceae bacterium]HRX89215.1 flagellar basal-body rod protein FlgF [Steroidobacteraceae bacterium]